MDPDSNNNYALSIKSLQKQIEKLTMDLQDFDRQEDEKIDMLCDKLDEIELKVNEIQNEMNASKNGKLLWKISNIQEATQKAIDEKEIALFSDTIYTGICGYKLRAVAYLNGIASGLRTHLSLYIMIEMGGYDALLRWPFKQKVHFTLLDQSKSPSNTENRTEELLGDRNSTSFQRPKSESNPGWGFPKFISLDKLKSGSYIKDDCMFVKIEVEPYDIL